MKINRLSLTNFRSHQSTEFALDRVTIIRGPNAAGKSSIQDGLEFLFTGTTRQTDAAGRGADLLIQHGKNDMCVLASLDEGPRMQRMRNKAGGTFMVRQPGKVDCVGKVAEGWMLSEFYPLPVLQAVLNSGRFLSLSEKEQKNLLTSALASKPVLTPPEVLKALSELKSMFQPLPQVENAAEIDKVYQWAYDARTGFNREIKALGELTPPEIPQDTPDPTLVKRQLAELNKERDTLLQSKSKREANHISDLARRAAALQVVQELTADILSESDLDKMQKTAGRKAKAAEVQAQIEEFNRRITEDRALVKQMREAPDSCYACGRPLVKEHNQKKLDELEDAIRAAEQLREEAQTRMTKLGDPTTAELKIAAHKKAVIATGSADRALKELKDLPETCDVTDMEEKIAALDKRIADGGEVLAEVQRLTGAKQQYDQAAGKKQELANRVLAAEKIITAFGPGGPIRAQLVGDRIDEFRTKLNNSLWRLGFGCELELEPFALRVGPVVGYQPEGLGGRVGVKQILSPRQLSESEAFRFGIAFQIALAEATGVNFVVIDRSDMLLPDLRSTLAETLLESKLDQAIVLVAGEPSPIGALPPEVKLYDLAKDQHGHTVIAGEYKHHAEETVCEEMPT